MRLEPGDERRQEIARLGVEYVLGPHDPADVGGHGQQQDREHNPKPGLHPQPQGMQRPSNPAGDGDAQDGQITRFFVIGNVDAHAHRAQFHPEHGPDDETEQDGPGRSPPPQAPFPETRPPMKR